MRARRVLALAATAAAAVGSVLVSLPAEAQNPAGQKAPFGAPGQVIATNIATPATPPDEPFFAATEHWWKEGRGTPLPAEKAYADPYGKLTIFNANGPVTTKGHPFFEPIGTNGRACVTCHQPADSMSLSAASARARWDATGGKDPLFAAVDGSNCPSLPQADKASHSLLLDRGLFRISLPWPPKRADGTAIKPEFTLELVRDPTGCNSDPKYGMKSAQPMVSVYRRPRPVANLKYVVGANNGQGGAFIIKDGSPASRDPETGRPVTMQIMSDAREPTLRTQAVSAAMGHLEAKGLSQEQLKQIVDFEMQVYSGQTDDRVGGTLVPPGGPEGLGPRNLASAKNGVLGDYLDNPVFKSFDVWRKPVAGETPAQRTFRESVARGSDVFFLRPFWMTGAMHISTVGMGSPTKRTCATCHNMQMTGMDLTNGWMDLGTTNLPTAMDVYPGPYNAHKADLPLFKVTCDANLPPHPFYGRVIYTQDPGRALISGKCNDVGAIVMQQFRGLSARAPYFSNGSARTLRELVDFYDRRFNIHFTEQEKQDLTNFLSTL